MDKNQTTCNIENCTNCCIEKEKCTDHKCNDDDIIASGDIYCDKHGDCDNCCLDRR